MPINRLFAKEWVAAGYNKDPMASARVMPPPPAHLVRAYHLTTKAFAISNLNLKRLKVSRFSDSNDPFELLALAIGDREARAAVRRLKKELDDETGLLCFSANWSSPPLWTHYGENHCGICLGFDIPRDKAIAVSYANTRLQKATKNIKQPKDIDNATRDLLFCTKFSDWSYERELRIKVLLKNAIKDAGLYFWPFGKEICLKEVILGPLVADAELSKIRQLVDSKYPGVKTYKARLAFKSFCIVPDIRTVP